MTDKTPDKPSDKPTMHDKVTLTEDESCSCEPEPRWQALEDEKNREQQQDKHDESTASESAADDAGTTDRQQ